MRKIAILNQKGGVGKTTTAVNLSAGLSRNNKKVILIDLDPQGDIGFCHSTYSGYNIYHFLMGYVELKECISQIAKNLDIIYADYKLSEAEEQLGNVAIDIFAKKLSELDGYDYIIIDCPPSLRLITKMALNFVNEVIIPTSTDVLGYNSLEKTVKTILSVTKVNSHKVSISCILPTLFDKRNKICVEILTKIRKEFTQLLVTTPIRINSKLKESPRAKMSIFSYEPKSSGAEDYWNFVRHVLLIESIYDLKYDEEQRLIALREYYDNGRISVNEKHGNIKLGTKILNSEEVLSDTHGIA